MIKAIFSKVFFYCVIANISFASDVDSIKWSMQDYPPFTYFDQKLGNTGLATDIVATLFKRLNAKKEINSVEVVGFARGISQVKDESDSAFFTVVRLPERESLFKWVGPVGINRPIILARKDKQIKISDPKDLNKYTIGTKRNASIESLLRGIAVQEKSLDLAKDDEESVQKFQAGRTDLLAINDLVGLFLMKKFGMKQDEYEVVYRMEESNLDVAFNKSVSDDFINKMQAELNDMKVSKNGELSEYDLIVKRYQ